MLTLLQSVVAKGGTAQRVAVPGYTVAAKTGTSWLLGAKGYEKHRYTSSFIGIAPATDPRLVVLVIIRDPQGKNFFGGLVAGPVFAKIMSNALRILNVSPDKPVLAS